MSPAGKASHSSSGPSQFMDKAQDPLPSFVQPAAQELEEVGLLTGAKRTWAREPLPKQRDRALPWLAGPHNDHSH